MQRPVLTPVHVDVIHATLDHIEQMLHQMWTCQHCGHQTTLLSEVCDGCGIEDCEQGYQATTNKEKQMASKYVGYGKAASKTMGKGGKKKAC